MLAGTNSNLKRLASSIAKSLNSRFKAVEVIDVKIDPDFDRDGDPLLRVLVVFNGEIKDSDIKVVAGAAMQLQPALEGIEEDVYPVLSFVSKLEYESRV